LISNVIGHGLQSDEYFPRQISSLTNTMKIIAPGAPRKSTLSISAGASCSLLQLPNGHVYYWGKHRSIGEATMRPSLVDALANNGHVVRYVDAGYQSVMFATANAVSVAWGQGQYGELGLADVKSSSKPTFIPSLDGCRVASLACGYGHTLFIVRNDDKEDKAAVKKLPELDHKECQPLIDASEAKTKKRREK
jgi:alpha-tubulin suppressor-like RCC1 family protein